MKIVCGSCGAKYSIADEKVQGKVFKIRCKKCSNVIVVEGDENQPRQAETRQSSDSAAAADGGESAGAAEWYVVVDGDQVGPIGVEEVESYFDSGQIGPDTFAWRDGLADWVHLRDLDAFNHLVEESGGDIDQTSTYDSSAGGVDADDDYGNEATKVIESEKFEERFEEDREHAFSANAERHTDQQQADQQQADQQQADQQQGFGPQQNDSGQQSTGFDEQGGYGDFGAESGTSGDAGREDAGFQSGGSGFGTEAASAESHSDVGGGSDQQSGGFDQETFSSSDSSNDGMFASFDSGGESNDDPFGGSSGGSSSGGGSNTAGGLGGGGFQSDSGDRNQDSGGGVQSANEMVGQRSENSVLFSLSSLDEVEAVSGPGDAQNDGASAEQTEGSGLIDIQALASAHKAMKGRDEGGGAAPGGQQAEDPFGAGTMSMPAMMPMGSHKRNTGLIVGLSVAGVLLLGGVIAVTVLLLNQDDGGESEERVVYVDEDGNERERAEGEKPSEDDKVVDDDEEDEAANAAKAANEDEEGEKKEEEDDEDDEKEDEEDKEDDEKEDKEDDKEKEVASRDKSGSSGGSGGSPSGSSAGSSSGSSGGSGGGGSKKKDDDDISDIIGSGDKEKSEDKGSGGGGSGGGSGASEDIPDKLERSDVKSTVAKYNGRIKNCHDSQNKDELSGTIFVRYTVATSGRVSSTEITTDKFKGTDVGKCVENVVNSMEFPKAKESLTINYPFILK
ncbi:MAG: AgmX/PglI C-terminal domain-containing protein [Persicimonas sp.]